MRSFDKNRPHVLKDLLEGSKDDVYRALSFAARRGGPPLPEGEELEDWADAIDDTEKWLQGQIDLESIDDDYREFRKRWSPVFGD
jgi:hypothetical protein